MMVLPSDHFVSDDGMFMDRVAGALEGIRCRPEQIVLLGAEPSEPETDYGWIELGERLTGAVRPPSIASGASWRSRIRRRRTSLYKSDALWNTFVFGGSVRALVAAGHECLPALHERLVGLDRFLRTEHERWAMAQAYEFAPRASFSRALLERCPEKLVAMRLTDVGWCDLGTSRRVIRTLDGLGIRPDWLATLQEAG
jgi:mannose-1-phosphate guanylyltransferase